MDALTALLDNPRARGAYMLRIVLDPPWSIRVQDRSALSLVAMVSGGGCVVPQAGAPVRLDPGDVAVVRGVDPYLLADDPSTAPQVLVHPGQRCATPDGEDLRDRMTLGTRAWGTTPGGSMSLLLGVYEEVGAVGQRLLNALPPVLVVGRERWDPTLVQLLGREMTTQAPGQDVLLDRLLDLLLVCVLRTWLDQPEAKAPGWYRALGDPVVGRALRLLHDDPARPWTVATLAAETGTARATLARAFTGLVGSAPMTYLREWRLALAADLLREPSATVDSVAHRVGYSNGFALSTAFTRTRGVSPRAHRAGGPGAGRADGPGADRA
ncbi:AraC family transcriptional regulator [Cellulomonas cellasea]|uniref:AraC-like DNA-binding protein n=1 Tax=Cellulomonas cellasea TaxID=43670 RepID=A0A7W4UC02_9CELL|nr:AraC family transcriptional regulator [Cellulomonas cellasea]MBB2921403.1 AraC-like DNA-binding protein [Cellulomonas cellasea]